MSTRWRRWCTTPSSAKPHPRRWAGCWATAMCRWRKPQRAATARAFWPPSTTHWPSSPTTAPRPSTSCAPSWGWAATCRAVTRARRARPRRPPARRRSAPAPVPPRWPAAQWRRASPARPLPWRAGPCCWPCWLLAPTPGSARRRGPQHRRWGAPVRRWQCRPMGPPPRRPPRRPQHPPQRLPRCPAQRPTCCPAPLRRRRWPPGAAASMWRPSLTVSAKPRRRASTCRPRPPSRNCASAAMSWSSRCSRRATAFCTCRPTARTARSPCSTPTPPRACRRFAKARP